MGKFFISRPIFAISMAIAMVLLGIIAIFNLAIEQYPDITPPVVEVTAEYYGADAQTVNSTVATPIAQAVMGVSDLLYMQTTSANDGSMTLEAVFEIGSNADIDAILTQNRLSSATSSLPESVTEQGLVTQKTSPYFLMVYALYSDGRYDDNFLTNYAYINLQNELLKINGVSKVQIMGSSEYAMRIWLDPQKMSYYNISTAQIEEAIEAQTQIYAVGKIGATPSTKDNAYTYTLTLPSQISSPDEFAQIILRSGSDGQRLLLEDVARIELGSESYDVTAAYGTNPSSMLMIYQSPGSNAIDVSRDVEAAIAKLSKRLPDGVECRVIVDSTASVKAGIKDIFKTLIIALLLVIAIIYLFLQSWRATLIPLIAIPVSLVGAFILFPVMGFSINIISLLGLVLAIGLVVDDAIVVVEAVEVNLAKGMTPKEASAAAMRSVTSPIVATTIVLLAVFVPISMAGGVAGLLFEQFAAIISLSVIISAINALTLSPALSAMLLKKREQRRSGFFGWFNRRFDKFMGRYTKSIGTLSKHIMRTMIFVGVVIVAIVMLWNKIPQGFLPQEDQGYLMVMVETPANTSLRDTKRSMMEIDEIIAALPQVELTSLAAGFNMIAGISTTNCGIIFVNLVDYSKRTLSSAEIAQKLNEVLYVTVMDAECYAFIPPAIPGLGMTSGVTFEVQDIEGRGEEYLYAQTQKMMKLLEESDLTQSVTTQYVHGIPQREIVVDRQHALNLGINLEQLYDELGAMLGGSYINHFNRFGRLYETYIQAEAQYREDEQLLENIYIGNSSGEQIPLNSFAKIEQTSGVEYVTQFNLYRSIGLTVMPSHKASSAQVMELVLSTLDESLPQDIDIAWSGVSYQQSASSKGANLIYLVILAFVFLVLAALYNSWGLPLAILMGVPIAVLGAMIFVGVSHMINAVFVNDVYMQISLIMLIALAAKNAILVVEYATRSVMEEGKGLMEATVEAARLRVRPIIMTAFAFILGITPLVFASGVYATARNIIGIALVGGMGIATLVGIFLYPALFYMVAKLANFEKLRDKRVSEK
ncbi:MAG: efflux RND transporter permease subunit [Rikenellaceae bacterium]